MKLSLALQFFLKYQMTIQANFEKAAEKLIASSCMLLNCQQNHLHSTFRQTGLFTENTMS